MCQQLSSSTYLFSRRVLFPVACFCCCSLSVVLFDTLIAVLLLVLLPLMIYFQCVLFASKSQFLVTRVSLYVSYIYLGLFLFFCFCLFFCNLM